MYVLQRSVGESGFSRTRAGVEAVQVGKYLRLKTIGTGNFAKVKLAKHSSTNQQVLN